MDFFRSVFTDEPDPPPPKSASDAETSPEHQSNSDSDSESPPTQPHSNPSDGGSGWSNFGGLIRTLTTKSESVIETYRRDLQEFSTGLRKEIEVAQGSLENVGQAFDEIGTSVIKGTAQIISHGKEAILSLDHESDSSDIDVRGSSAAGQSSSYDSRRYSRFDAQVSAIQGDASTFCDEPEDMEDYGKWRSWEFALQDNRDEIESLLEENGTLDAIYKKVVPGSVDEETFWARYYYRIYKLKQAEALRANLVKRAISAEEEDLSWDVDDDDDDDESEERKSKASKGKEKSKGDVEENQELKTKDYSMEVGKSDAIKPVEQNPVEDKKMGDEKSEEIVQNAKEVTAAGAATVVEPKVVNSPGSATASGNVASSEKADEIKEDEKSAENSGSEGNGGNGGSCKDSDYSVVSSHQTAAEEEDLGWDEIEDLSGIDDSKKEERRVSQSGSNATKEELRKRLSVAEEEEEEDLSWDIEDDDEPIKA
ncbi:unnamed protein product [Linum tenue]|uniref:BSD domain-containing protein n=1 Tax=Linum tenue TaxID=586396 RepID=A0AAV0RZ70_9ROSI|nr:unnamed protein product [Linum tenue]